MIEPSALVGKVILIGVALYRADGEFIRMTQVHGVVKKIESEAGIVIEEAETGKSFFLPPAYGDIHAAVPGVYRARDTEIEVVEPDFVTQWGVRLPEGADETTIDWQQGMEWRAAPPPPESESSSQ